MNRTLDVRCQLRKIQRSKDFKERVNKMALEAAQARGISLTDNRKRDSLRNEMRRALTQVVRTQLKGKAKVANYCQTLKARPVLLMSVELEVPRLQSSVKFRLLSDTLEVSEQLASWGCARHHMLLANPTPTENIALRKLRGFEKRWIFQQPIHLSGRLYFADFYFPEIKTVLEIDGGYHSKVDQQVKDEIRTAYFNAVGISVIRVSNSDVASPYFLENLKTRLQFN